MTEIKAPEGGRPVSELWQRLARAIWESRAGQLATDGFWAHQVRAFRELADEFPQYPLGGDGVSDAFRDALAVMKAMREPTAVMKLAGIDGGPGIRNQDGDMEDALNEDDFVAVWTSALDAEISIAEGGKDG